MAGPFYLVVGLAQALLVPGFDLSRHALSLLLLGPLGWIQAANLVLSGLMVLAAAVGFARLLPAVAAAGRRSSSASTASASSPRRSSRPIPTGGFPPGGTDATTASTSGLLHLAGGRDRVRQPRGRGGDHRYVVPARGATRSRAHSFVAAAVIVLGFLGGAALAMVPAGVGLLWLAVLAGWAWLAIASLTAYRMAPRPVG